MWLGNDDGTPTKKVSGGNLPVEIWSRFMKTALTGTQPVPLPGSTGFRTASLATRKGGPSGPIDSLPELLGRLFGQ